MIVIMIVIMITMNCAKGSCQIGGNAETLVRGVTGGGEVAAPSQTGCTGLSRAAMCSVCGTDWTAVSCACGHARDLAQ